MMDINGKTILVTGSPGFIGANIVKRLLRSMDSGLVISLDNMNDYYDVRLKQYRLEQIEEMKTKRVRHIFVKGDISSEDFVSQVFNSYRPQIVIHLAAQAGVRHSVDCPKIYIDTNIIGFYNILEACRKTNSVRHLIYASSSSVYGGNTKVPFSTEDMTDSPVSLYAATKKSAELLANVYSNMFAFPATGLRFFTVYGPAGRPDMFYYSATEKLVSGKNIKVFNNGDMKRDFTYIDDIVEGLYRVVTSVPEGHRVYNIGGGSPVPLMVFLKTLSGELQRVGLLEQDFDLMSHVTLCGMQAGDVTLTYADTTGFDETFGFVPQTSIKNGLGKFAEWYKEYKEAEICK